MKRRVSKADQLKVVKAQNALLRKEVLGRSKNSRRQNNSHFSPFDMMNPFSQSFGPTGENNRAIKGVETLEANLRNYLISNFRSVLSWAYSELHIPRNVVDVPVDDAYRGGITYKSKELDENDLGELKTTMKRHRDLMVAKEADKWRRLFGGGFIMAIVDDQDPEEPLDLAAIGPDTEVEFRAGDLWELFWNLQNVPGYDLSNPIDSTEWYDYYGKKVHHSRVMILKGDEAPSFIRPRLRGWGTSVLETLVRPINQYLKTGDLTFELLDEFKLDIWMLDGLAAAQQEPGGAEAIRRRVETANGRKNYLRATVLDAKDQFQQRQLTFTGVSEIMRENKMDIASALRMPLTKIFGISAAGFNSGEDDIEVYNGMVESTIRDDSGPHLVTMAKIRCQQRFGFIPEDLEEVWKPLRVLGAKEEQEVKASKIQVLDVLRSRGDLTRFEMREAVNKGGLLDITLDNSKEELNPDDPDIAKLLEGEVIDMEQKPEEDGKGGPKSIGSKGENDAPEAPTKPKRNELPAFIGPRIVSVAVVCEDEILTGRRRDNGLWTSTGGHVDEGETLVQAAIREVKEEAGISIQPQDLVQISEEKLTSHRTGKPFRVTCYVARIPKERATAAKDPDKEMSVWKWVKLDPTTPELKAEVRHAKPDSILEHFFRKTNESWKNSGKVDEALWDKAKRISVKAYGEVRWPFVNWWYQQQGGTFQ